MGSFGGILGIAGSWLNRIDFICKLPLVIRYFFLVGANESTAARATFRKYGQ
jgi:hypothetical protein